MSRKHIEIEAAGVLFRFLLDKHQPELLHLEANGYDVEDAIDIYFDGSAPFWMSDRQSFETLMGNRGIWWKRIDDNENHILIWSMFTRYR